VGAARAFLDLLFLYKPENKSKYIMRRHWVLAASLALVVGNSQAFPQDSDEPKDETPGVNSGLVSAMKFRGLGPAFMSGSSQFLRGKGRTRLGVSRYARTIVTPFGLVPARTIHSAASVTVMGYTNPPMAVSLSSGWDWRTASILG